jgi:glutathione S-transferase
MKLFYAPGVCSLSPNIVAHEAGIELRLQKVDTKTKTVASPGDYWAINPKGYVPALELDNGEILTEGPTIAQYLADLKPAAALLPPVGTLERFRVQEMLGYINSELHKTYSMLFKPGLPAEVRAEREEYLLRRYELIDKKLEARQYLFGDRFTVADAYLFTVGRWAQAVKVDLSRFANLQRFQERVGARPAVQAAMRAEGLGNN